jgi:replicative DNA helicase
VLVEPPTQVSSKGAVHSLSETLVSVETSTSGEARAHLRPLPLGFSPLDEVLTGGLRPGDLMVLGGSAGVGKTILALQAARNIVVHEPDASAVYLCYEHDEAHLSSRLMCLESAGLGHGENALTMAMLGKLTTGTQEANGLMSVLRSHPLYGAVVNQLDRYADRLFLTKASGRYTTLNRIAELAGWLAQINPRSLLVIDYIQKIPVESSALEAETDATTFLAQGVKDIALDTGLRILAIAAMDRAALRSKRARFSDMRGSSALQYEADIGLILNNKFDIVSREHLVYNDRQAQAMQRWLVVTVEKNRSGVTRVDMEHPIDGAHFRIGCKGGFVHERLIDERVTLE